jgi:hypothetical protein
MAIRSPVPHAVYRGHANDDPSTPGPLTESTPPLTLLVRDKHLEVWTWGVRFTGQ